jgi:Flp pilus assembly protein TadD/predicted AlkP superfamily phosphohydrolase/phosphomutase
VIRVWALLGVVLAVWILTGIRHLDPNSEFGVLDGPLLFGSAMSIRASWAVAPPGLLRLTRYPSVGVELPLPQAEEAALRSSDGSVFGFRGWVTIRPRPEAWRPLHEAAAGDGIRGALRSATRMAAADLNPNQRRGITATLARNLERRLSDELASIGVDLRRFDLDALDYLAVNEGDLFSPTDARLLIVGLDGADWEIIDPLIEQGRLPHLESLIRRGVRAKLLSISPLLSPVIWTTVATGVEPNRHGVLDFIVEDPADGSRQPVTSAQRRVPALWEILSSSGVDVGVVGWWATWPADPVNGYLVSDRIAYQLFGYRSDPSDPQGKTWPPELYDDVRSWIVAPDQVPWSDVQHYLSGARTLRDQFDGEEQKMLDDLRTLIAAGETYASTADTLRERFEPQLEIAYFEGTDTVGHLFMPYRLPALPGVDPARIASFSGIVDRYYETADRYLGQLLEERDETWTIMVVSDHGFATDSTRPRTTDSRIGHGAAADWHRRFGVLILAGAHIRAGAHIDEASIYDIAPTVMALFGQPIPQSWPGRVLGRAIESEFLERHPVRLRRSDPTRQSLYASGNLPVDPAAEDLIERLQSLGYISGDSEGSASVTARNNSGVSLLGQGRFADAEREFRAGLSAAPEAYMLKVNLAVALRFQGRSDEAIALLEEARLHPSTLRMAGTVLAQILIDRNDLPQAEARIRDVLALEPDAADAVNLLGRILEMQGDSVAAREIYMRSSELDPDLALPRNNLGNLAKLGGQLEEAERWYLAAIDADPYFMGAYNNLALVYQDKAEMEKALDLYERALEKAPRNAELLNNVGSWYYATGDHDQARTLWTRAIGANPGYPSPLNNLAGLAIRDGRHEDAERLLNRALVLDPDYGDARLNLALVLRTRGDTDGALRELQRATEDPRSQGNAWPQLGFFELEAGHPERAASALERAVSGQPGNFQLWSALGEAYRLSGQVGEATRAWRRSLELKPEQPRLRQSLGVLETAE